MSRYDSNPFNEEEVSPFADQGGRGKRSGSNYGGSGFSNNRSVPPAISILTPLPPELYDRGATIDIRFDNAKELKDKEKELQAKEAKLKKKEDELKRREDAISRAGVVIEEKNWLPFVSLIHHDIPNEIPIHQQKLQYIACTTYLRLGSIPSVGFCRCHHLLDQRGRGILPVITILTSNVMVGIVYFMFFCLESLLSIWFRQVWS